MEVVQGPFLGEGAGRVAHVAADEQARSPAPVKTITPTASSSAAASKASASSRIVCERKAFSRSGRLIVIVALPPATS